jgi:hypothetical protein
LPALDTLGDEGRRSLHEAIRARWSRLVQISILFLLVSGLVNFGMFVVAARDWPGEWRDTFNRAYQILFGIKVLLALAIFALASILSGRGAGTQKIRDNSHFWLNINLAMALAVVIISGVMRLTHVGPSEPIVQKSGEPTSGG